MKLKQRVPGYEDIDIYGREYVNDTRNIYNILKEFLVSYHNTDFSLNSLLYDYPELIKDYYSFRIGKVPSDTLSRFEEKLYSDFMKDVTAPLRRELASKNPSKILTPKKQEKLLKDLQLIGGLTGVKYSTIEEYIDYVESSPDVMKDNNGLYRTIIDQSIDMISAHKQKSLRNKLITVYYIPLDLEVFEKRNPGVNTDEYHAIRAKLFDPPRRDELGRIVNEKPALERYDEALEAYYALQEESENR